MAGRVNQIDSFRLSSRREILGARPIEGDGCGLNGDSSFPFQFEEVSDGVARIYV